MAKEIDSIELDVSIPRLKKNRAQRLYYQLNFRRNVKWLWFTLILNAILLVAIIFFFLKEPSETYYATSFSGQNTQILPQIKEDAVKITLAHQNDT